MRLTAGNSTIRGLAINRFGGAGIHVQLPGGTNFIQGNFIGTDPTGTLSRGNGSSVQSGGVWIDGSSGNWIGGPYPTNRNVISGNSGPGVYLLNCAGNTVQGNLIGTSVSGTAALGNSNNGISLYNAPGNQVGGTAAGARNVISGNGGSGVYLNGSGTTGNLVQGNYIGTDTNGSLAIPNAGDGVTVNGAPANTIGGTSAGAGNLLSGNSQGGVALNGAGADSNLVQGNLYRHGRVGQAGPREHAFRGHDFWREQQSGRRDNGGGAQRHFGQQAGRRLSHDQLASGNLVQGNFIGVDVTGTNALGNAVDGISIDSASSNTVGGTTPGARNVISGNTSYGIEIYNATATGNSDSGQLHRPGRHGTVRVGQPALRGPHPVAGKHRRRRCERRGQPDFRQWPGRHLSGWFRCGEQSRPRQFHRHCCQRDQRVGERPGGSGHFRRAGEHDRGNHFRRGQPDLRQCRCSGDAGIYLFASGATGNLIQGNKIGTDVTGTLALGNTHEGIYLESAPSNTIGGVVAGAGNLISGNGTLGASC